VTERRSHIEQRRRDWRKRDLEREERTAALFAEAAAGPPEARTGIHQRIVIEHLDVAESIARRYAGASRDWSDLRQVAYLGLVKAVKGFDPGLGHDFMAYSLPTIAGEVKKHLRDHGWFIRPPRAVQELRTRVREVYPELTQDLQHEPSVAELAESLDAPRELVDEVFLSQENLRPASLDVSWDDGESPGNALADAVRCDDTRIEHFELVATLARSCRRLTPRDRRVLYLRFFEEQSQAQIGRELNVTQMQVSRILSRVLNRMRDDLRDEFAEELESVAVQEAAHV